MQTFHTPEPVRLRIEFGAGDMVIEADSTDQTTVDLEPARGDDESLSLVEDTRIEQRGNEVLVKVPNRAGFFRRTPELRLRVQVPTGSELDIRSKSADIEARGTFGDTRVESGSGDVRIDSVEADARLQTGSGDISIETVAGLLRSESGSGDVSVRRISGGATVSTGSGDVSVDQVDGEAQISSASGDVMVGAARSSASASTASGDIELSRVEAGRVRAQSASGDIHVGVSDGVAAWLDVNTITGDVHSSLEGSDEPAEGERTVEIRINTASGDVTLTRA